MTPDEIVPRLLAFGAWLATDGRAYVFVALMSVFLAAFVVLAARQPRPEAPKEAVFQGPRRPPAPGEAGWRSDAQVAAMLLDGGKHLEAIQAYRRLLEVDPADPDALYNLGHAYFRMRLYAQARHCWRAVRRLEDADDARANLKLVAKLLKAEEALRRPSRSNERLRARAQGAGAARQGRGPGPSGSGSPGSGRGCPCAG